VCVSVLECAPGCVPAPRYQSEREYAGSTQQVADRQAVNLWCAIHPLSIGNDVNTDKWFPALTIGGRELQTATVAGRPGHHTAWRPQNFLQRDQRGNLAPRRLIYERQGVKPCALAVGCFVK
jgi:hypothetical protein